jgi:hypothetical protein
MTKFKITQLRHHKAQKIIIKAKEKIELNDIKILKTQNKSHH